MRSILFSGAATALTAPYTREGLDHMRMTALIDRQIENGVAALVVNGTTGEAATLSEQERQELLRTAVVHTAGRVPVIAGIGANDTDAAVRRARHAERVGADAVLLTAPYYNKASPEGLRRHFLHVADNTALPLIVYNVPGRTAIGCTAELYARLAEHPRICGVKEASGDISLVSRTQRLCGEELAIWSGNDDQTLPMLALGARGVISVASNLIPGEMAELCRAGLSGDMDRARALHRRFAELFELLFSEVNPIPVKTALHAMGLAPLSFRLPLCPMEETRAATLLRCLEGLGLTG